MAAPSNAAAQVGARAPSIPIALLGDERLARLVARGSERAFRAIYDRYHQRLYRYCYSLLHDSDDAYDALQSTLVRALAALQRGQRDAPLRPWLFRIAHNEAISEVRRRGRAGQAAEMLESRAPSAEDRAGDRARVALLAEDLRELPERERSVLLMRELGGLSHQEIAVALGISIHAIRHAIFAARRTLGEFEQGRAMICTDMRRSISNGDARVLARARARGHLRDCAGCAAFAAAIPARRADLQLLAPPLAPVLAAGLLATLHGTASAPTAGGGVAAGIAGKTVGAALAAKTVVGVAIVASAAASMSAAASPAKRQAVGGSTAQVSPASSQRVSPRPRERPIRAGAPRQRPTRAGASGKRPVALTADAARGQPSGANGLRPEAANDATSAAPADSAAGGGTVGPEESEAVAMPELSHSTDGAPQGKETADNARHPRGFEQRSLAGAQHGRGPSEASPAPPPVRAADGTAVAVAQRPRGSRASDVSAQSRAGQAGQTSSADDPASPAEAPAPDGEAHASDPAVASETPPPAPGDVGGTSAPAHASSREKPESPAADATG